MIVATPISHLFEDRKVANRIIKVSDCLELRDHSPNEDLVAELYHSDLQLIHPISGSDIAELKKIRKNNPELKCISFHAASCFAAPSNKEGIFESGQKLSTYEEMIECSQINIKKVRDIFGKEIKILVENNNFYPTPAYDIITNPDFISEIVQKNKINFLYDIAHAKISAHNMKIKYDTYRSLLPIDNIYQVHICKYAINTKGLAYDAHNAPDGIEFDEVKDLSKNGKLKYLTIEYYKSGETLVETIQKLKNHVGIS